MKTLMLLVFAASGCIKCPDVDGRPEASPAGYPVVAPDSYRLPQMSKGEVMRLVDLRVAEWISKKADWNLDNFPDKSLVEYAKSVPIIVYDSDTVPVPGNSSVRTTGWNQYGCQIRVPIYQGFGGENMATLPHELTHTVLKDFHK